MRVIVSGPRDWTDDKTLYQSLERFHKRRTISVLIEGDGRGVDRIAGRWARENRIDNIKEAAQWTKYGLAAGPIRNQKMLDDHNPDALLAPFPGHRGTPDMKARAHRAGVPVYVLNADGLWTRERPPPNPTP